MFFLVSRVKYITANPAAPGSNLDALDFFRQKDFSSMDVRSIDPELRNLT